MAILKIRFTKTQRDKLAQLLWLLNWISVVTGIIIFSSGLYLKVEINKQNEVIAKRDIHSVPNMLITVGLIACVINFVGGKICYDCADTNKYVRWKLLMLPYIMCTFFFTLCVLISVLMCYTMHMELNEALALGLNDAIRYYKDTDTPGRCFLKHTVDLLQIQFQCCGNTGYRDWFKIQWISNRYLDMSKKEVVDRLQSNVDGNYLVDGVPFSCCNINSPRPCIQHQITNNLAHFNYDYKSDELNLWSKGCHQVLLEYYTAIMHSIGLTVLLIWFFELSVLTGVRYLQTALENVLKQGNPESESDGWLMENSFVETARSNFLIKSLKKCNQIEVENVDPNINKPPSTAHYGPENMPPIKMPAAS